MPDDKGMPTAEDLEKFRNELVGELELTRDEVRKAFEAAAEPLRTHLPDMLKRIAELEARVQLLEFDRAANKWPQPPVC